MYYAYANKDQMRIWHSARSTTKGIPDAPDTKVMFSLGVTDKGMIATLTATDGYQMLQRNISVDDNYIGVGKDSVQIAIPGGAIAVAEKTMKAKDRAYISDTAITVMSIIEDEHGDIVEVPKATVPFIVQDDLFKSWEGLLEREEKQGAVEHSVTLDARSLKIIADQLRSADAAVFVKLSWRGSDENVILSAFDDIEDEAIKAVVVPIAG